jgi:hypothetical protein
MKGINTMPKFFNHDDNSFMEASLDKISGAGAKIGALLNSKTIWFIKGITIVLFLLTFGLAFFVIAFVKHTVKGKKK